MARARGFTLGRIGIARAGAQTPVSAAHAGIRIVGKEALIAKFRAIDNMAQLRLGQIMRRGAMTLKKTSQANAPINKRRESPTRGALKAGHHVAKVAPYTWTVWVDTASETGRDYAGYQEFGYYDRGGNWHEGRGFMRAANAVATAQTNAELAVLARQLERL